jgi:hypothetical protein
MALEARRMPVIIKTSGRAIVNELVCCRTQSCNDSDSMSRHSHRTPLVSPECLQRRRWLGAMGLTLAVACWPGMAHAREAACQTMTMLLIDITGSFNKWRPGAVDAGRGVIARLRAGDCLVVRTIGSKSFDDAALPPLKLPTSSRPIDPALQRRVAQLKSQAMTRLEAVRHMPAAGFTDIWGAVLAAGETLAAAQVGGRSLLIYSDLEDNVGLKTKSAPLRLDGVRVTAAFIPRRGDPTAFRRRIGSWATALREAGAVSVSLYDTNLLPVEQPQ